MSYKEPTEMAKRIMSRVGYTLSAAGRSITTLKTANLKVSYKRMRVEGTEFDVLVSYEKVAGIAGRYAMSLVPSGAKKGMAISFYEGDCDWVKKYREHLSVTQ
jgi:hypothetical protein|tara:strand:+ start:9013 stop:9321 length:309 start_codon:yes stop_codon:yes gene_type:complete